VFPQLTTRFDRVIGVMGNSHFHTEVFDMLMRYGGACIEHDNRLLGFYRFLQGEQHTRAVAERELKRPIEPGELEKWLGDEATLDATFLGELAERSQPLCVHSRGTARLVRERFDITPTYLPFSVYRSWSASEFNSANRLRARDRLGLARHEVAVVSLGYVSSSKAPEDCIWAIEMLRGWNIPAKLYFVGEQSDFARLTSLRDSLGLESHVRFAPEYTPENIYRDYLLAADVAVQLRTHLLGGLSGALLDCIAVGLPAVANQDLATSMETPSYVAVVPDRPSPVLIAEALANLVGSRGSPSIDEERRAYCGVHNFEVYAERLCEALALDVARVSAAA
jgi:glycosyltransferase involved in cell wall biosynthesis